MWQHCKTTFGKNHFRIEYPLNDSDKDKRVLAMEILQKGFKSKVHKNPIQPNNFKMYFKLFSQIVQKKLYLVS